MIDVKLRAEDLGLPIEAPIGIKIQKRNSEKHWGNYIRRWLR